MIGSLRENRKLQALHRVCGFFLKRERQRERDKRQYCAWGLLTPFPLTLIEPTIHFKPTWRHVSWCATRTTEMDSAGPQPRPPPWPKLQQRRGCLPLPACPSLSERQLLFISVSRGSSLPRHWQPSLVSFSSLSPSLSWQWFVLCSGITHRWCTSYLNHAFEHQKSEKKRHLKCHMAPDHESRFSNWLGWFDWHQLSSVDWLLRPHYRTPSASRLHRSSYRERNIHMDPLPNLLIQIALPWLPKSAPS